MDDFAVDEAGFTRGQEQAEVGANRAPGATPRRLRRLLQIRHTI